LNIWSDCEFIEPLKYSNIIIFRNNLYKLFVFKQEKIKKKKLKKRVDFYFYLLSFNSFLCSIESFDSKLSHLSIFKSSFYYYDNQACGFVLFCVETTTTHFNFLKFVFFWIKREKKSKNVLKKCFYNCVVALL
jgi:hypothetical protein